MNKNILTYEKSGVNIKATNKFVKFISSSANKTKKNKKFNNIRGFGSITKISRDFKNPHLVASTDGVSTKIKILKKDNIKSLERRVLKIENEIYPKAVNKLLFKN